MCEPAFALVHAGDQLQITVYNHPDLSRKVVVDADERVSLPLAGTVDVRGLDPNAIAERIVAALTRYVKKPAVDVELAGQTDSIFVSGGPSGVLKYAPGESLTAAVTELVAPKGVDASASGDPFASVAHSRLDLHRIRVERDGATLGTYDVVSLAAHGNAGPLLQPGDTIAFENKPSAVRILGAVKTPGTAYVSSDESLTNAIEESGGILDTAATSHVLLQRGGTTQSLSLGDSILSAPAVDGDVLTVPTAPRISVVGVVARPGVVALKTDFSLLNAIYQAGGPLKQGDLAHVSVIRSGAITRYDVSALVHGDTSQNPVLSDGDVVFVPQGKTSFDFFAVLQAVSPIFYLLPRP